MESVQGHGAFKNRVINLRNGTRVTVAPLGAPAFWTISKREGERYPETRSIAGGFDGNE